MKQSNYIYLYDGSFENLCNVIAYLLKEQKKPINIQNEFQYQPNLLDETLKITNSHDQTFQKYIATCLSQEILHIARIAFLKEQENIELIIYYFLLNAFKYGPNVIYFRNLNCVTKILKIKELVSHENHRIKGFLRFQELQNHILYAKISPDHNILELLSKHFKERMKEEKWIIYDEKRKLYSIYAKPNYHIVSAKEFKMNQKEKSVEEENYEDLWITFFKTIAIKERTNLKCQRNFMPKKYWKNILEMEDQNEKNNQRN